MPPEEAFAAVERILLETEHLAAEEVLVRADSALTVRLTGGLWLGPDGRARLDADGRFEIDTALRLVSDGTRMAGGRTDGVRFDTTAAPALREALVLGLTRMGLLHNLARLYGGSPPDHAEGGVTDWVTVHGLEWRPETLVSGRRARPLGFTLRVDGTDAAEAELHLDAETGLPLLRRQTVAFPAGVMVVEEQYSGWTAQAPDAATFSVASSGAIE